MSLDILSDLPSTSRNRFNTLADDRDMELDPVSNINEIKTVKPPPLVVDENFSLRELQVLMGSDVIYKRTSIGTKVFPNNTECYENSKKVLIENKL